MKQQAGDEVEHGSSSSTTATLRKSASSLTLCTPNPKRRRRGVASPPTCLVVKQEVGEDGATKVEDDADCDDLWCVGCFRLKASGREWGDFETLVNWACPDRRGRWCKVCFVTWRTLFSHAHTLRMMAQWITVEANYTMWEPLMLATASLIPHHSKVTAEMIRERTQVFSWLFNLVGMPSTPFVVVPLAEAQQLFPGYAFGPRDLVTTCSSVGNSIGVMVPKIIENSDPNVICRPGLGASILFGKR